MFGQVSSQAFPGAGVRLVAVPGGAAHAGLLEMEMEAGGYGTVRVPEGFNVVNRRCIDLAKVLTEPWA